MEIFRKIEEIKYDRGTAVTIGTFDGVHLAHRSIIEKVKELAEQKFERSFIVTFDPHPQEVLRSRTPDIKLLNTIDEKLDIFEKLGIDAVFVINFTVEFSKTHAVDFYEKYICNSIGISDLVVGFDHLFGRNREGDFSTLQELGTKFGFHIHRVEEIDVKGEKVSSTRIRKHLAAGEIEEVYALLGYDYGLKGTIVVGDMRGRTLGFPTANVEVLSESKAVPGNGVYITELELDNERYYGMMNIGVRPTLTDAMKHVMEVHIFDFDKDVYGNIIRIKFLKKLRNEQKFSSKEELLGQLNKDKQESLTYISKYKTKQQWL